MYIATPSKWTFLELTFSHARVYVYMYVDLRRMCESECETLSRTMFYISISRYKGAKAMRMQ